VLEHSALSKTCRDDTGTVLQAETPGQPLVKDAGIAATPGQWQRCTKADRRPVSSCHATCQAGLTVIME